ncbi:MAG: hypothetical protein ABSC18_18510 [Verrucomicrobiota bacterium]
MNCRRIVVLLELLLLVSGLTGQRLSAAPATEILARVHWLGLEQISADTNSARFMSVWRLPQTASLVAQTLDKFSRWPANGATNAASALLRPLLDDLVSMESYLEVYAPTGSQPSTLNSQLFLALRLPADRDRLWRTNLAAALETLTGVHPVPAGNGWVLQQSHPPQRIEFSHIGLWTLVGWGQETNLLSEFAGQIARNRAPSATNFWLEANLDLPQLAAHLPTFNPQLSGATNPFSILDFPSLFFNTRLYITALGEGGNVVTRGNFNFSRPLDLQLSPWEIPTNLVHQPLIGFTAVRGLAPWLAAWPAWRKLQLTPPPNQLYFWVQQAGAPFQSYFAAPLPAASNQLSQLAARLMQNANPWLATNGEGNFQWATNPPGLVWKRAIIMSPFLNPIVVNQQDYALGGLAPLAVGGSDPPAEILRAIFGATNLVYCQFEQTGARIEDDLFNIQLFRLVFHKPQLPAAAAATLWLKNVGPMLGGSATFVTQTGAERLTFTRKSTIGFTALELHLLGDWLESPQFPHGLHTVNAPPDN